MRDMINFTQLTNTFYKIMLYMYRDAPVTVIAFRLRPTAYKFKTKVLNFREEKVSFSKSELEGCYKLLFEQMCGRP